MLTQIATIAATITALIGVGYKISEYIQKKNHEKWMEKGLDLERQIMEAKTDEERAKLVSLLAYHRAK